MEKTKYFELVRQRKFLAQKELGQNYLIDFDVCERIVKSLDINKEDKVIEIGCGLGSLSYFLNESEGRIELIDIDESSISFVKDNLKIKDELEINNKNALKVDYSNYNKVIGNLPYYITSSILERVLLTSSKLDKCVFMVQKEAFDRINAKINTEDYGPLSILLDYVGKAKQLFGVSRHSFVPEPRVDSCVFEISFKEHENIEKDLYQTLKALFMHRRKTIYNNLKSYIYDDNKAKEILEKLNISLTARPESLSTDVFVKITKELKA